MERILPKTMLMMMIPNEVFCTFQQLMNEVSCIFICIPFVKLLFQSVLQLQRACNLRNICIID